MASPDEQTNDETPPLPEHHPQPSAGAPPGSLASQAAYYARSLPATKWLLVFVPISAALYYGHAGAGLLFVSSALATLALVTMIGKATEEISLHTNATVGGLLNATFGNVTELIIAIFALKKGLYSIVKASIVGSIIGNLLLLMGLSMVAGGLKYPSQKFNRTGASNSVAMLALVLIAMVIPAVIAHGSQFDPALADPVHVGTMMRHASVGISVILLLVYGLSLVFSLGTHKFVFMPEVEEEQPRWSKAFAIGYLLAITVLVGWESDVFVDAVGQLSGGEHPLFTQAFMGIVIVATVGNAAEGSVAIWVARQNKMELSFQVAMGSCIQVALFVAPMLVLLSFVVGPRPMTLDFSVVEIVAMWASVLIASLALQDGETNWFEGVMFLAVYVIFAMVFYDYPDPPAVPAPAP